MFKTVIYLVVVLSLLLSTPVAMAQLDDIQREFEQSIEFGPCMSSVGGVAQLSVPEDTGFVGSKGTELYEVLTDNLKSGDVGTLLLGDGNAVFFGWDPSGFVSDDEKADLNSAELLKQLQKNEEERNQLRRREGKSPLLIQGWMREPYYDATTGTLEYAVKTNSGSNFFTKILGRRGVMHLQLVSSPDQLEQNISVLKKTLKGFQYNSGERYADFRQGDQVASYGLAALIAGGGTAAAAKSGLLAKLGILVAKGGKLIFIAIAGVLAVIGKLLFGPSKAPKSE